MRPNDIQLLAGDRVSRVVWKSDASRYGTVLEVCKNQCWERTIRVRVQWDSRKHPDVTGIHLLKRITHVSLENLEIKKYTDPIQKELDTQKEKASKWKQAAIDWKRKAIQYASVISKFTLEMKPLVEKLQVITPVEMRLIDELQLLSAAIKGDIVQVGDLRRGDIVSSLKELDIDGVKVRKGAKGVVYQPANFTKDNAGPMVRWFDGGRCNVYDGDVAINEDNQVKEPQDTDKHGTENV